MKNEAYLKHLHGTPQKWLIVLAGASQSLNAPEGTETECAFLASHTVIRFIHIISVDKVLPIDECGRRIWDGTHIRGQSSPFWCLQDTLEGAHKPRVRLGYISFPTKNECKDEHTPAS